jgi:hypothetical protein
MTVIAAEDWRGDAALRLSPARFGERAAAYRLFTSRSSKRAIVRHASRI